MEEPSSIRRQVITPDNATTFRIIAKDVREFHFITPYRDMVEVGEIFTISDLDKNVRFISRVKNIQHSSNYGGNWDTTLCGTNFYDSDQIFNRVIAEPLGYVADGRFKKSRIIPTKFAPVHRSNPDELAFLSQVMGDIDVGCLRNGSKSMEEIEVALHSAAMDHHMGVFATTGMGKSNFMRVFAASCMKLACRGESKFGLLIVDPHGEYIAGGRETKGLMHLRNYAEGLKIYTTERKHARFGNVVDLKIRKDDVVPEDLEVLFQGTTHAQGEALAAIGPIRRSLMKESGGKGAEGAGARGSWMDFVQTEEGKDLLVERGFHPGTIEVIRRRIRKILLENKYLDNSFSKIDDIIRDLSAGKVVLIDVPNISEESELFLLSILSRRILTFYKGYDEDADDFVNEKMAGERQNAKNCLIVIEEAQRILGITGTGSTTKRFQQIAREGRKFGVGLCAITQQPSLIDKQLLAQFNTLVILGLSNKEDRASLESSAKQDLKELDVEIQTLEKGEAVISTLNIPFPVPVVVHKFDDYIRILNGEQKESRSVASGASGIIDARPEY